MCQQYWSCIILSYARITQMGGKRACALFPICRFYLMCKDSIFYDNCKRKAAFYFPKATQMYHIEIFVKGNPAFCAVTLVRWLIFRQVRQMGQKSAAVKNAAAGLVRRRSKCQDSCRLVLS